MVDRAHSGPLGPVTSVTADPHTGGMTSAATGAGPLDVTRPLRGVDDLEQLVTHIHTTNPQNETDWLEWKIGLDLSAAEGRFDASKHILGFANRSPNAARRHVGGLAYLVLGIEPGRVVGQSPMDPAQLTDAIRKYVGTQGAMWTPLWVTFQGAEVLVITIEAPQWGDPIRTLQNAYDRTEQGAIFVRHPGTTQRANTADIEMLTERVRRSSPTLELTVAMAADSLTVLDGTDAAVNRWIDQERAALMKPLDEQRMQALADHQRQRLTPWAGVDIDRFSTPGLEHLSALVEPLMGRTVPENRSEDEYVDQVERYLDEARSSVVGAAIQGFLEDAGCVFEVVVENTTSGNLQDVEVEITFDSGVLIDPDEARLPHLPNCPRIWGPRQVRGLDPSLLIAPAPSYTLAGLPGLSEALWMRDHTVSGRTIVYHIGHMRPRKTFVGEPVRVVAPGAEGEILIAHWTATSTGVNGVLEGDLELRLGPSRQIGEFLGHPGERLSDSPDS